MFKNKNLSPTSLVVRIIVGGYLLYLAYTLIPAIQVAVDMKEKIFWIAMIALFSIAGLLIVAFSAKALLKGEYEKAEENEEENSDENTERKEEEKEIEKQEEE